jgi:hypothetical protein
MNAGDGGMTDSENDFDWAALAEDFRRNHRPHAGHFSWETDREQAELGVLAEFAAALAPATIPPIARPSASMAIGSVLKSPSLSMNARQRRLAPVSHTIMQTGRENWFLASRRYFAAKIPPLS